MSIFKLEGEEVIEKEVGNGGESGRIYVHKKYIGLNVKIVIPPDTKLEGERGGSGGKGGRA